SPASTVRLEGHTRAGPFTAWLNPILNYEVLVVPDAMVAPQLWTGSPSAIAQNAFKLDPGVAVDGQVTGPKGPVEGARVLLRTGAVPSTTGAAQADGHFDLRVRPGDLAAAIIAPSGSGLPEARIAPSAGLVIYDSPPAHVTMDFAWSSVSTATLDLTVR